MIFWIIIFFGIVFVLYFFKLSGKSGFRFDDYMTKQILLHWGYELVANVLL